jgi:hypothetical protein
MRKFLFLFVIAATAVIFLNTGCGEDDIISVDPTIEFLSTDPTGVASSYPTTNFSVDALNTFAYVAINALAGSEDLETLTVQEDGSNVPTDRLSFRDLQTNTDVLVQNPILLIGYANRAQWEIGIKTAGTYTTKTYTIIVEDVKGNIASVSIDITTFDPGTPLTKTLQGVLLNQAGPSGTGALDLDDGEGVGTMGAGSEKAEIRDWGIDLGQPVATNWRRQIGPINGTTVRYAGGLPGDFKFADISTVEEIQAYYNAGTALPNSGGTVSNVVAVGDYFVVKNAAGSRYYFLEVVEVTLTSSDNNDSYKFNIKY